MPIVTDGNSTCNIGGVVNKPLLEASLGGIGTGDPEVITVDSKSEKDFSIGAHYAMANHGDHQHQQFLLGGLTEGDPELERLKTAD